ncbi:MAG TPA: M14 family metallopeptidase [Longimicrobiales bacterium]|nr:M14 family metallopeptidase [Longimicrobiales bacterium]
MPRAPTLARRDRPRAPRLAGMLLAVFAAGVPSLLAAQAVPDDLLTRAERTEYRETTRYEEVMDLLRRIDALSDRVHLTTFGYTNEGRSLPLAVVGAPAATPEAVLGTGKTRVYLQGNIHGAEVEGKEALLMLLRRWATGPEPPWADDLVLLVAPIYNADGNERVGLRNRPRQHGPVGGMGTRANAQGLDLNRDHMKLDSPEARSLVGLLNDYDPHVVVDLHTTDGTHHAYHLTYASPMHPNTAPAIDAFLRDRWLPEVTERVRRTDGWELYYYGNTSAAQPGWYTFDHRPRYNNNYVGLRNRMAILSEAYAYLTFEERVRVTTRFVEEILDFAQSNAAEIQRIVAEADEEPVIGRVLATRAGFQRSAEEVTILMGEVDEVRNPFTGETMLLRRDVATPVRMYEYGTFAPTDTEVAPRAYYLLPEAEEAIERLEAHGLALEPLADARAMRMERFRVDSASVAGREYEGRRERTVWGAWVASTETLPAGTVRVSMDQPLARLAFTLLEPRSDDGLVAWSILDPEVRRGTLSVLREPAGS